MINLVRDVKKGEVILCIGSDMPVKEYKLGEGFVYCRNYGDMEPLPEKVDIVLFMDEPIGETRAKLVALTAESTNPRIFDAWKDDA